MRGTSELDCAQRPPVVHLAASGGGHLELLVNAWGAFEKWRRVWVTTPCDRADELIADGEDVRLLPPWEKRLIVRGYSAQYIARSLRLVAEERPRVVVSSGAGPTVPFCAFSRLQGSELVFVETVARVTTPSSSGRLLSRITRRVFVQWPEAVERYPHSRLCRPQLLEALAPTRNGGRGTFAAVGTHRQPFDRMLRMLDEAVGSGVLPRPALVQTGHSRYEPKHLERRQWMRPAEIDRAMNDARYVVTHGGGGTLLASLRASRRPIVIARREALGEHINDHQLQLAGRLADLGLAVAANDRIDEADLERALAALPELGEQTAAPAVEEAVRGELDSILGPAPV